MKRVTMKSTLSGSFDGVELPAPGSEAEVPEGLAEWLVAGGHAEAATAPAPKKAEAPKAEQASAPKPTTRRKG